MELAVWQLKQLIPKAKALPLPQLILGATVFVIMMSTVPVTTLGTLFVCAVSYVAHANDLAPVAALSPTDHARLLTQPPPFRTVFFPGHGSDLNQLGRYVGTEGLEPDMSHGTVEYAMPAHSRLSNSNSAHLIYHPCARLDDAMQPYGVRSLQRNEAITLRGYMAAVKYFLSTLWTGTRGGTMTLWDWRTDNIAQKNDVARGLSIVRSVLAGDTGNPAPPLVLFGASRGASVALQVAAALSPVEAERIGLLVIEGAFDDSERVMNFRFGGWLTPWIVRFLERFTEYRLSDARRTLEAAKTFPHTTIPILMVTSQLDSIVPPMCTETLAATLTRAGSKDVSVLTLTSSPHSSYATADTVDRRLYADALAAQYTGLVAKDKARKKDDKKQ